MQQTTQNKPHWFEGGERLQAAKMQPFWALWVCFQIGFFPKQLLWIPSVASSMSIIVMAAKRSCLHEANICYTLMSIGCEKAEVDPYQHQQLLLAIDVWTLQNGCADGGSRKDWNDPKMYGSIRPESGYKFEYPSRMRFPSEHPYRKDKKTSLTSLARSARPAAWRIFATRRLFPPFWINYGIVFDCF